MVTKKESNRISKAVQTIMDGGGSVRHSDTVAQSGGELAKLVEESGEWDEDVTEFLVTFGASWRKPAVEYKRLSPTAFFVWQIS